jgi:two-component system, NtrC family, response regulator HydG
MATPLVMIVDNRPADQLAIASIVHQEDCQVLFAEDFAAALAAFRPDVEIVICRAVIDAASGIDLMRQWHGRQADVSFVFLIDQDSQSLVRAAIKAGAAGSVTEPIDVDELRRWIRKCRDWHSMKVRQHELEIRLNRRFGFDALIGQSKAIQVAVEQARAASESVGGAIVTGEPGTEKSVVAEMIHQNSRRAGGPFVTFHVWGMSVRSIEQELFGFGSFGQRADARSRPDRIEKAAGGTLLIDDIADLAAVTQARLVRTLERRLPGDAAGSTLLTRDVRLIAASARRLDALAAEGRFSARLYRKLSENQVRLPALRERREDIPLLVDHYLRRACEDAGRSAPALESELSRFIQRFDWPGNVRQLRECLESMLALNKGEVLTLDDLPARIDDPSHDGAAMYFPAGMTLGELERTAVEQALAHCEGNRTRAAERLGISVRTLQRKLKSWSLEGIDEPGGVPRL